MSIATDTPPGAVADRPGERGGSATHLPGEAGTWVFILGDMLVFALLFGVYLYYRGQQPVVFAHSQATLHAMFGVVNTLLLLTSSLCVVTAVRATRAGIRRLPQVLFGVALLCGAGFAANKVVEWGTLLTAGHTPAANNFYMYFFVLTGLHFFHLLLGMGVLTALIALSRKPALSDRQFMFLEGGACFWHMVDLLWIVLFALLYLVHS
jgi:nitric oxide reductase NorE protein